MPTHGSLTPRLAARIVQRVARGLPIETIAAQLGLSAGTLWQWQNEGRNTDAGREEGRAIAVRLARGITHARAHREWHVLERIERIAEHGEREADQLKADQFLLERHPAYRDRYGIKVEVNHSGQVDHQLRALERKPTLELIEGLPAEWQALVPPADP